MRRRSKFQIGIIAAIGIALIVMATVMIGMIVNKINTVTYENHRFYQYFSGMRFDYEGTLAFRYNGEVIDLGYNGIEIESNSVPIYFADKDNSALLPKRMALIIPRNRNTTYLAERWSEINVVQNTTSTGGYGGESVNYVPFLKFGNEPKVVETPAFLYDGDDMYLFLSDADVVIAGQQIRVSPLSFVTVDYGGDVEIYNYGANEDKIFEAVEGDVMAKLGEGYNLDLSTDMLLYDNGTDTRLLVRNIDALENTL